MNELSTTHPDDTRLAHDEAQLELRARALLKDALALLDSGKIADALLQTKAAGTYLLALEAEDLNDFRKRHRLAALRSHGATTKTPLEGSTAVFCTNETNPDWRSGGIWFCATELHRPFASNSCAE